MNKAVQHDLYRVVLEYVPPWLSLKGREEWANEHVEIRKNKGSPVWHLKIDGERVAMVSYTPGGSEPAITRYDNDRKPAIKSPREEKGMSNDGSETEPAGVDRGRVPIDGLDRRFTYHAPKGTQPERYIKIRATAKELAELLERLCPASRERSLALTNLEQAVMWANASIARNE